ncbi:MAG: sensor histidine kinase [Magnetococcales bacterium]|nr:sensor histidine kinase [Magnetococcales bacterium]
MSKLEKRTDWFEMFHNFIGFKQMFDNYQFMNCLIDILGVKANWARWAEYCDRVDGAVEALLKNNNILLMLWLLEKNSNDSDELRLARVFFGGGLIDRDSKVKGMADQDDLRGITLDLKELQSEPVTEKTISSLLSIKKKRIPFISYWIREKTRRTNATYEAIERLNYEDKVLGYLHIVGYTNKNESEIEIPVENLWILSKSIAVGIANNRKMRLERSQARIYQNSRHLSDPRDVLGIAAQIIKEGCEAQFCRIYYTRGTLCDQNAKQGYFPNDEEFSKKYIISDSLIRSLVDNECSAIVDIADDETIKDPAKRLAWMGVPGFLNATLPGNQSGMGVFFIIEVYGKRSDYYLCNQFDETDLNLVESVRDALIDILPKLETHYAFTNIAGYLERLQDEHGKHLKYDNLGQLIKELLPCSEYSATITDVGNTAYISNNDQSVDLKRHYPFISACDGGVLKPAGAKYVYCILKVDFVENYLKLIIALQTSEILDYRHEILKHLCQNLKTLFVGHYYFNKNIQELLQIRHAVRSGMMGMVGHLETAKMALESIHEDQSESSEEIASILESLGWASFFSERSKILLDGTRYLLGELNSNMLRIQSLDIRDIVNEVVSCVETFAKLRRCRIIQKVNSDIKEAVFKGLADKDMLFLMLFNIIENAIKYSVRKHPIIIYISAAGSQWRIDVRNVGEHIPDESLAQIFNPFFRLSASFPDARKPGTGIGLTVAKQIAEAHHRDNKITPSSRRLKSEGEGNQADISFLIQFYNRPDNHNI